MTVDYSAEVEQSADAGKSPDAVFLGLNNRAYEWLLTQVRMTDPSANPQLALERIRQAAAFAGAFHCGRFADGAIENIALHIGREIPDVLQPEPHHLMGHRKTRRILHVASQMTEIAGHSRMLGHWIRNDPDSCHSLVVTSQGSSELPDWLAEVIVSSGGEVEVLPAPLEFVANASRLRAKANQGFDLVVLHHDGHDVLPTVAFSTASGPPVAVLNHADHQFWLGNAVADIVIELRTPSSRLSETRRGLHRSVILPVPLVETPRMASRSEARASLGIPADGPILLSIGRGIKYRPCGALDFSATAARILERLRDANLYVIGETVEGISPHLRGPIHPRLHFMGSVVDPTLWRAAADVYLESFPFGSQTALLEAALAGLPVVPACAPLFELLVANDDALSSWLPNPPDEHSYVDRAVMLAQDLPGSRAFGSMLRDCLIVDHVGVGWRNRLQAIYHQTDTLLHRPRTTDISACRDTPGDVGLSWWHAPTVQDGARGLKHAALEHGVHIARTVGDYSGARRSALAAVRNRPRCRKAWRMLGVALLGSYAKTLRTVLNKNGLRR